MSRRGLPDADWETLACGLGAKGPRLYDRVLAEPEDAEWGRYVLFRRFCVDPDDGQAYFVYAAQRQACALETLVRVAGTRGCIKRAFEDTRQEVGLAVLRTTTLPDAASPVKKAPQQPGGLQTVPRAAVRAVATPRARPAPRAGLAGLEAQPRLDGPVLPLPKTRTANYSTTVVLAAVINYSI